MCLAVPGKIKSIVKGIAIVDYGTENRKGKIIEGTFKEGDYVILQGGIVAMKIPEKEAIESLKLFQKLSS